MLQDSSLSPPARFIGLDIHKEYFVAVGVNSQKEPVFVPQTVPVYRLDEWIRNHLTQGDAVVLEMTVNSYLFYDCLQPFVHSVTLVHPPHVGLVTRVQVKTDRKAAQTLAELHAVGMLEGIWVPPLEVRELRSLVAHREKMVRMSTKAKNRLATVLHRNHLVYPGEHQSHMYHPDAREWWEKLSVSAIEKLRIRADLDAVEFAQKQVKSAEEALGELAAKDERVPLLVQLPGCGLLNAITILAAVGTVSRFESAKKLVGYAGLGTRVHASGMTHHNGRITKAGRKDLRSAVVSMANTAAEHHPFWKKEFERISPRLGRSKAIVAIARRLLVAVWHVLKKEEADRHAVALDVARSFFAHAYRVGVRNLPGKQSALQFTRSQLDRLKIGAEIERIPWGTKSPKLPPSKLTPQQQKK
jgi:transposase